MIAIDSQPFSIVEDTGFVRLMKHTCPRYIAPSRKYFSEKIIPEMYANLRQRLFDDIHSDDKFSISFTTDIWSRDGGESFISWTAHYITSEFHRDERVFQVCPFPGSHTADTISGIILKLLDKWSIDKSRVHAIVHDNAANMVAGIRQCGLSAVSCTIHTAAGGERFYFDSKECYRHVGKVQKDSGSLQTLKPCNWSPAFHSGSIEFG